MEHGLTRREFLAAAAGGALVAAAGRAAALEPPPLPRRTLGRTGRELTVLGIGIGALGDGGLPEEQVCQVVTEALDQGINFLDTAPIYGRTQAYVGPIVEARRSEVFLTSKVRPVGVLGPARKQIEDALTNLRTDHVDLCHIHMVADHPLEELEQEDGVLTVLRKAKEEGLVRAIGASGHHTPGSFLPLFERAPDLDAIMVPINMVDRHIYSFESAVIPKARELGMAVIAMKLLGGVPNWQYGVGRGRLVSEETYTATLRYGLCHEAVTAGIVGFSTVEELAKGLAVARELTPLSPEELTALEEPTRRIAAEWGAHYGPL